LLPNYQDLINQQTWELQQRREAAAAAAAAAAQAPQ
jgi:hypothetical protein